jgi:hypothetical protein
MNQRTVTNPSNNLRFHHAMSRKAKLRTFASFMYKASPLETAAQRAGKAGMRHYRGATRHVIDVYRPPVWLRPLRSAGIICSEASADPALTNLTLS